MGVRGFGMRGVGGEEIREFKIAVYRANVKLLHHNTARDPSTFHVAVCRSRLYV